MSQRRDLGLACAAAAVATGGDFLLLAVANSLRPELGLARPPALALPAGGILGVAAIPLYALGYRAVARAIRPVSGTLARVVLVCGAGGAAVGALVHGLTALAIRAAIAASAASGPPVEGIASSGVALVAAWMAASALVVAASAAIFAAGTPRYPALPRSVAWPSPAAVTVLVGIAGSGWEWGRAFLVPAGPNLAHVVFFACACLALRGDGGRAGF